MTDKIRKSDNQKAHSFGEGWVRPSLVNEEKAPGTYEVEFNSHSGLSGIRNLPSGLYFYTLIAPGYSETKKMILIK